MAAPNDSEQKGGGLMQFITKVSRQGNSLGVRLSKEMVDRLHLRQGDPVVLNLREKHIEITKADDDFNRAMELGKAFSARYRRALDRLAK
jgi:putative addiction module antidote